MTIRNDWSVIKFHFRFDMVLVSDSIFCVLNNNTGTRVTDSLFSDSARVRIRTSARSAHMSIIFWASWAENDSSSSPKVTRCVAKNKPSKSGLPTFFT